MQKLSTEAQPPVATPEAFEKIIGRIVSVTGSHAVMHLFDEQDPYFSSLLARCEMGAFVKVETPASVVIGLVSGLSVPVPSNLSDEREIKVAEIEFLGELRSVSGSKERSFQRGISIYPGLADKVALAASDDLDDIFRVTGGNSIRIGRIRQDLNMPAQIMINDLLGKHFAIVGSTGAGKSCTVALILKALFERRPGSRVVLLDPHNEYASGFGGQAESISPEELKLPHWLLTFEELTEVVLGGEKYGQVELDILHDVVREAKRSYLHAAPHKGGRAMGRGQQASHISVDAPLPYRLSDVVGLLAEKVGQLMNPSELGPYKRLKSRIEFLISDSQYAFMFGNRLVSLSMEEVLGRLFRIPIDGKPLSIIDLSGVPSEIVNVVVSVIARMAFDLAVQSDRAFPLMLVCEEAHRYVPDDDSLGFGPTKRAISRIAKEGRKYGLSLGVVTQRPADIDPTILSQSSTIFAMRLTNDRDQHIVRVACSESGLSMLEFLPTMANGEAIAFGEGVPFPMRIVLDTLPEHAIPCGKGVAEWSGRPATAAEEAARLTEVIARWRSGML